MSTEPPRGPRGPLHPDPDSEPDAEGGVVRLPEIPSAASSTAPRIDVESLPRGTQLGRYVLLGRVARTPDEVVYAAYDPDADRKVVLKLYDPGGTDEDTAEVQRLRLARQGQALAKLDHPCVERIHEAGVFGSRVFLAAEFVDGLDVRHWMEARDEPFPWPEVLRVFREAGRGLAAAHKAGVVHRDFRPSNVMIGSEGRIVVIDFGLAPELEEEDGDVDVSELRQSLEASPEDTESLPTLTGMAAYLAPERHLSEHIDARSDQFGFCVALYEALYGERPFSGNRPRALALAAAKHEVRAAPAGSTVPGWLRRIVLRGLSPRPDERFSSMEALLRELSRDPSARRRRWIVGAAVAGGLAIASAGSMMLFEADEAACEGTSSALAEVWNPERRDALRASFLATGRRWTEPSWRYTESRIDGWADTWRDYSRLACMSTRVWGNAAERTYELRVACLDRNLAELDATLEVLETIDGPMLDRSHELAQRLADPRSCTDTVTLELVGLPDEERRDDVEALHRELAALEARLALGHTSAVRTELDPLLPRLDATGDRPLAARGRVVQGGALLAEDEPRAEAVLHEAATMAIEAGHGPLLADAWRRRVEALRQRGRAAEASALSGYLDALLVRKRFGWQRTGVEIARGHAEHALGNPADALAHYYAAIEHEESLPQPTPLRLLPAWLGQADVLVERNEIDEAMRPLTTALDVAREELGPEHPAHVEILRRLGRLAQRRDELGPARHHLEQALEIVLHGGALEPARVAELQGAVGSIHAAEGNAAAADLYLSRAYETLGGTAAADRPEVFRAGLALARSHRALARGKDARQLLEALLAALPRTSLPPALELAEAELLLADVQWEDGDQALARDHARRAFDRLGEEPAHRARRREAEQWLLIHAEEEDAG